MGKGSRTRPRLISDSEWSNRFDEIDWGRRGEDTPLEKSLKDVTLPAEVWVPPDCVEALENLPPAKPLDHAELAKEYFRQNPKLRSSEDTEQ